MLKVIEFFYDGHSLSLVDETEERVVIDEDVERVQWLVSGAPNDSTPRIDFLVGEDEKQPWALGPFLGLRQNQSYVISDGLRGGKRTYGYRLSLVKQRASEDEPSEIVASTGDLALVKDTRRKTTGITIIVRPDGEGGLKVEPEQVERYSGDTVSWVFKGIAESPTWLPRVEFYSVPEESRQLNRHFGPFTSLYQQEDQVIGSGTNGVVGDFGYVVQVVDATTGSPLRSAIVDPGVGDQGDPPGGAGG